MGTGKIVGQTLSFDNWQVKDGLPQNSINHILQTRDGYIWLATGGGLVRFDGVKFEVFNTSNTNVLKSNRIYSLFETNNGDLLIYSYESGLVVYQNNQFVDYSNGVDFLQYYFEKEAEYAKAGERRWVGKLDIVQNKEGLIYLFLDGRGLTIIDPVNYQKVAGYEHLANSNYTYVSNLQSELIVEKDGELFKITDDFQYLGSSDELLYLNHFTDKLKSKNWRLKDNKLQELKNGRIIATYEVPYQLAEKENHVRIARHNDVVFISNEQSTYTVKFNLKTRRFTTLVNDYKAEKGNLNQMYTDREGNIWFATSAAGLFKVKPSRFTYIDTDERIPARNFYPIVKDHRGHIIVGSQTDNYAEFDTFGNYVPISPQLNKALGSFYCYDLEVYNGALYIPVVNKNKVYKIKENRVTELHLNDNNKIPGKIYRTKRNELLVGVHDKILMLINDSLVEHPANIEAKFGTIVCFLEDSKDRLWVVSDRTLFVLNAEHKLLESYTFPGERPFYFRGIFEDKSGRVYVGSYGNGLAVVANDTIYNISMKNGLFENVISSISEDKLGYLWFTGNAGLTRVLRTEIVEILERRREKVNAVIYNEDTDVMRTAEFNGGNQHPKLHLQDDVYLFPTINGCVEVNFADFKINQVIPPVHIEHIKFGDSIMAYSPLIQLPYAEQRLEFFFTALSFVAPNNVRFKFKLEGYDQDWVDGGKERKTYYNKLPPGTYEFKVKACNNDGIWNEEGASLILKIIPPFHMTWWFRILAALSGIGLVFYVLYRLQRRKRKIELEKSALMDILPDLVLKLDRNGKYLDCFGNPSLLIQPFDQLKGRSIAEILDREVLEIVMEKINLAYKERAFHVFEYNLKLADGINKRFEGRIIAKDKEELLLIVRDITEATTIRNQMIQNEKALVVASEKEKELLRTINEQQKQQLEAIINTEEKERKRIANDLHDGIGQLLTSVTINLDIASEKTDQSIRQSLNDLLRTSKETVEQITREIRNISYNLMPPSLEQFGLASAMEEELKKLQAISHAEITFYSSVQRRIDPKIEVVLFRAFQEILNNALKHARASEITVQLLEHPDRILMLIEDNGCGFNFSKMKETKDTSGLKNLLSRIALINGLIKYDSSPNSGTSVIIEVPIDYEMNEFSKSSK